jgi:hypothetical protein
VVPPGAGFTSSGQRSASRSSSATMRAWYAPHPTSHQIKRSEPRCRSRLEASRVRA